MNALIPVIRTIDRFNEVIGRIVAWLTFGTVSVCFLVVILRYIFSIGFEGRFDYAAIGSIPNLASRICNEAKSGQILISQRVSSAVEHVAAMESLGMVSLKGLARPIPLYNVLNIEG